jgi:hypothetical protein
MFNMDRDKRRMDKPQRSPLESIITGGVLTVVFGALWLARGDWWWAFPTFFAGVSPIIMGVRRLFQRKQEISATLKTIEAQKEKEILRVAVEQKGKLTPAGVALKTNLTIQEAQALLEKMTKQGYAEMKILSSGLIEFEFPEFLPQSDTKQLS